MEKGKVSIPIENTYMPVKFFPLVWRDEIGIGILWPALVYRFAYRI